MSGFYLMKRGWQEHAVWAGEAFSRRDAWVWLIEAAAYVPRTVGVGTKMIRIERGQLCHSLRFMARAWKWDEPRVRRFISRLRLAEMIRCDADAGQTVITICNYDAYQTAQSVGDAAGGASKTRQRRGTDANKKEGKEGKEGKDISLESAADFETFWAEYPLQDGRKAALAAFVKARAVVDMDALMAGLRRYKAVRPSWQAVASAANWLEGERWADQGLAVVVRQTDTPDEARARMRISAFEKDPSSWLADHWGAPPNDPRCTEPEKILAEFGYRERAA